MEKYIPTYDLEEFKMSNYLTTATARNNALMMGFDIEGIHKVILTMKHEHFRKSMTSYKNHKIWQDVYHVPYGEFLTYIKFTQNVISEFTLLSFKEK